MSIHTLYPTRLTKHRQVKTSKLKNNELVWHYTTGETFRLIEESGLLLPTAIGIVPPEKPLLWFSEHPIYEPTAIKALLKNGVIRNMTLRELYKYGGGLCRLGYPRTGLHHDRELREVAFISRQVWRLLVSQGRKQGSNPLHWWGTTEALPISRLVVEIMDEDMVWQRVFTPMDECPSPSVPTLIPSGITLAATGTTGLPRF